MSTLQQTATKEKRQARLPWPLPGRPHLISICQSPLADYGILTGIEAWDKTDPRAVAVFRCERRARGRAFADPLLLLRVPLANLSRRKAEAIFDELAARLRERAALEALP